MVANTKSTTESKAKVTKTKTAKVVKTNPENMTELQKKLDIHNINALPKVEKVIVAIGI